MEYTALNHANWETRLLRLVRRNLAPEPMKFEVEVVSLTSMPKYRAISYCWGDVISNAGMEISGRIVPVGQNLVDALYNCEIKSGEFVWADAICINQKDLHEKNYQVGFMDQIYARAEYTIAWVGLPAPGIQDAAMFLYRMGTNADAQTARTSIFGGFMPRRNIDLISVSKRYVFEQTLREWKLPIKVLHGFYELFSRPYWSRIWIIQEVAKSRRVELRCGEWFFDMELLLRIPDILDDMPEYVAASLTAIRRFREEELSGQPTTTRTNILQSLIRTRYSQATVPHDRIFALIGMSQDGKELVPIPSYTETAAKVFTNFTAALLQSKQPSTVLLMKFYAPLGDAFTIHAGSLDWSQLRYLPPWLTNTDVSSTSSDAWHFDKRTLRLYTNGRLIGEISHSTSSNRTTSPTEKGTYPDEVSIEILEHISSNILERFCPRASRTGDLDEADVTDALARIVRDADKGQRTANVSYDFDRIHDTAGALGKLMLRGNPLWEWARDYIYARIKARNRAEFDKAAETPSDVSTPEPQSNAKPPVRKKRKLKEWRTPPLEDTAFAVKASALRIWEGALDGLDGFPHSKLGFAVLFNNYELAMVHPNTDRNDEVFQIDQCPLPVVLRKSWHGIYQLVGEACFGREDGKAWMEANRAFQELELGDAEARQLTIALDPEDGILGF